MSFTFCATSYLRPGLMSLLLLREALQSLHLLMRFFK
jgi:hypothetical protein